MLCDIANKAHQMLHLVACCEIICKVKLALAGASQLTSLSICIVVLDTAVLRNRGSADRVLSAERVGVVSEATRVGWRVASIANRAARRREGRGQSCVLTLEYLT